MTVNVKSTEQEDSIMLLGTWNYQDAAEFKKTIDSLGQSTKLLKVNLEGLDSLPASAVQVFLALIRYARSVPRPVKFLLGSDLNPLLGRWGLNSSGWEHFFHGQ